MADALKTKYDVFVSYSHKDKDWVQNVLLPKLEGSKLKVIIDFRDFKPGAPSLTEMEHAILQSRKMVVVISPAYIDSAWGQFEAILMSTLDPGARENRLIPLLIQKCEIPLRLRYLTYVNLVDAGDQHSEWEKLLRIFKKRRDDMGIQPKRKTLMLRNQTEGYSLELLVKLRDVLMSCDELETDAQLRAVFNENKLKDFRARLPQATTIAERTDLLIDYLVNRRLTNGETLLVIFLNILKERLPESDERYFIVEGILKEI